MTEIARVRDREGRVHHSARESKFVQEGLTDGSLVDLDKESENAAANAQNGDDLDTGTVDSGSGQRKRASRKSGDSDSSGVAESASSS